MSASPAPIWETISHEVHCPLCEYNLRGLVEARCPECGYQFAWSEVTDLRTRRHPYLFEHHPERNVWSFFRTLAGTFWPFKFWRSLSPSQPSRPGRTMIYWLMTWSMLMFWVLGEWVRAMVEYSERPILFLPLGSRPPPVVSWDWKSIQNYSSGAWAFDELLNGSLYFAVFWFLWPVLTLVIMRIFRISMVRARVGLEHVKRCLVYSVDLSAWYGAALGIIALIHAWLIAVGTHSSLGEARTVVAGVLAVTVIIRTWIAFRLYLRFDHALLTVLASQVILFLVVINAVVLWNNVFGGLH